MFDYEYIILGIILYFGSFVYYLKVSHGLGHKAEYLQLRRFLPCAVLAVLPAYLAGLPLTSPIFITSFITGLLWIVTYPLFYYMTFRKISSDFGFHLDIVFGLYAISWLTSLKILAINFNLPTSFILPIIATVEFIIFLIPLIQWIYYYLYHSCVSEDALIMMQETDYNEVIEFFKQFSIVFNIIIFASLPLLYSGFIAANLYPASVQLSFVEAGIVLATALFLTYYLWKNCANTKKQGVFVRTGIIELFLDVKTYIKTTTLYRSNMQERIKDLSVCPDKPSFDKPSTIILVIGESESRDYMSAFTDYPQETTPWLSANKNNKNFILFPNSYSCEPNTVRCLERALTEFNQYNDKQFYTSCSIIDIARKAGYVTHWYSNQGHLGSVDTPVTLVANTADTAKWTKQNLNKVQYDGTLLEYLREVDPTKNNFIVFHLMGNHFNFINRYPQDFAKFSQPGKYDLIPNYLDSIRYTDYVLKSIWEYSKEHLNLQSLLYFSDHATIPDKRRAPNFDGFGTVRIPMFAYFSDEYIQKYPETYKTLRNNEKEYFTNDLAYDLMCGIFNITSNHYDETNSLASPLYKYTRETLKTNLGKLSLADDNS